LVFFGYPFGDRTIFKLERSSMEVKGKASQDRKIVLLEKGDKIRKFIINDAL